MTMLDRMRRHIGWLKWILFVVVIAFVLLYVPQFLNQNAPGSGANDVVATVNSREVTAGTYRRVYNQQVDEMRASYGNVTDQMLKQLGVSQRLVQQLVDQQAVLAEADRLGITVTDGELRERLMRSPTFQENGQFVGETRYREILDNARPPVRPAEFEQEFRDSLVAEKLQDAITGWIQVSDEDVDREFRRRNEKVKLDVAAFSADKFRAGITPTDAEISAEFAAHTDKYQVPEKRRVRYLSIDAQALRAKMTVTPQEVEQHYKDNVQQYATPEEIRASHILFKTEGKDDAAVKKLAESVLAKVKAGGDFAALAKQYSDDDSKTKGGDLDWFPRGTMIKEFDDVAWALQPGQVSDLVKSQFGYHIIKVTGHRPATTKPLDDVRSQIEDQIRTDKAQAEATRTAGDIAKDLKTPADFDRVAKARGMTVGDSGLFARTEPLAGLGFADTVSAEAFKLTTGKVSDMLKTSQGYAFITVTDIKPAHAPTLDEVKDAMRNDVIGAKALDVAKAKATTMAAAASHGTFDAAAKAAGVDVKTTDFLTRGSALPDVGVSDAVDNAAFALKTGETSAPISTDSAIVVVQVKDRQDVTPAALTAGRDALQQELTEQRRGEFFAAYMTKARQTMKILYNTATIQALEAE